MRPDRSSADPRSLVARWIVVRALGVGLAAGCATAPPVASTTHDPGAAQACTLLGCVDGLEIVLAGAASWPAGDYTVRVVADDRHVVCRLPLPAAACASEHPPWCTGDRDLVDLAIPCRDDGVGIAAVSVLALARRVEIEITRDGAELAHASYAPAYQPRFPNGERCGEVCRNHSVTLPLRW